MGRILTIPAGQLVEGDVIVHDENHCRSIERDRVNVVINRGGRVAVTTTGPSFNFYPWVQVEIDCIMTFGTDKLT